MSKTIICIDPRVKISSEDRKALTDAGVVVLRMNAKHVRAIDTTVVLPMNKTLQIALQVLNDPGYGVDELRKKFGTRMIQAYLELAKAEQAEGIR